jgi:acyl-CoA synthetase (AMP-forming)/AMP-acid ligase II
MGETGEVVTFGEMEARANQVAHWLRTQGVGAGDVVGLMTGNHARLLEFIWGIQRIGAHYLMIASGLTGAEVDYILRDSGARMAIIAPSILDRIGDLPGLPSLALCLDDALTERIGRWPETPVPGETPGADMLYSSGTTGFPKGIKAALPPDFATDPRTIDIGRRYFGFDDDLVFLCPAPLYHAAPLRWSVAAQRHGGTVVVMEKFSAEHALALIERYRVTVAQFVPTHMARLLAVPKVQRDAFDLSSLRSIFHAGAPCGVSTKGDMIDWLGPIVHEFYSGTESIGMTVATCQDWLERPGTVGRAVQGEVRICGEDGEPVPAGEEGLVRFAGGNRFSYHNDPEKTAAAFDRHGWPTLGDIGRLDADGYLYLTDRANFMIISGGVNIYPQEIENRLLLHAGVADVGVVGLPHAEMGETVTAFVEPVSWPVPNEAEFIRELDRHARDGLSSVKVPRRYILRQSLQRTDTGKLLKRQLRDRLIEEERGAATSGGAA